jgi:DNA mismatch repair protein MutS2
VDERSLSLLEFDRVAEAVAALAVSEAAAARLRAAHPIADAAARGREASLLAEAVRRCGEPGTWLRVPVSDPPAQAPAGAEAPALDGPGLIAVLDWIDAAADTRSAWADPEVASRHPGLAERVLSLPRLDDLGARLRSSLDPDGRVRDDATPELARARAMLAEGERSLERQLEHWARGFGEDAYVTRHGDRFVALVPAAGFPRRRGIVHDVSGSGHSLFVEPLEACEANNRLIELAAAASEEERRILRRLAEEVRAASGALDAIAGALVHLDSLCARARWAVEHRGIVVAPGGDRLELRQARHPLLASGPRAAEVVALDLALAPPARLLLVSGPNMGGKTVLLKTVGLSCALAHAAMPVLAAEGSAVPELDRILVDLGDEQSIDQGLSTFAAHLRRLAEMARHAGPRTMVLCDELGAGTDPEEGAALGRALIERFVERGAWGVVTTHLGSLKRAAGEVAGIASGSLEFDAETLSPRYRFLPGIPGASRALAMAERLGFDPSLVRRAREIAPAESRALERLLEELQRVRAGLEEERGRAAAARAEAEQAAEGHRRAEEHARRTVEETRRRLTGESEALLARARELWQTVQRESRRADKTRAGAAGMRERITDVERAVEELERAGGAAAARFGAAGEADLDAARFVAWLRPGMRVRVRDLGVEAELVSGPDDEGRVELRRGGWKIQSHVGRLAPPAEAAPPHGAAPSGAAASWEVPEEGAVLESDLRGLEVDEALRALDASLDRATLAGLSELRIVHGVGRGVLRAAVERHLRSHPQVSSSRLGAVGEGGRGVTVARLR